jgi:hypothetical protein
MTPIRPPEPVGLTIAEIEALGREVAARAREPSARALRNLQRALRRPRRPIDAPKKSLRKRCDARVKNPVKFKNGVAVSRAPRCPRWAMANGRCQVHGGCSSGPRTPEGMRNTVAALHEGRREWIARVKARGRKVPGGRKTGDAWLTATMRERARAEARRLGFAQFTLDRPLVVTLLGSARGDPLKEAKARALRLRRRRETPLCDWRNPTSSVSRPNCALCCRPHALMPGSCPDPGLEG